MRSMEIPGWLAAIAVIAGGVTGCKAVDPAPDDLDGLFHWFWLHYDDGTDADLLDAVANFHDAAQADAIDGVTDGLLSEFTREEMDVVAMRDDADLDELTGMFLSNSLPCTTPQVDEIVTSLDQMTQYDGAYDAYERTYTSDAEAYFARTEPTLSFSSEIAATLLGTPYTETILGTARWVPADDDHPFGPVLIARYWLPEQAVFGNDDFFFTQDYQLEIYYQRDDGQLVHLYGLWRNMGFGQASTADESIQRQVLNGLADWDEQTATLCTGEM